MYLCKKVLAAYSSTLCHQRCALDLLSHTESANFHVSIHMIVPRETQGLLGGGSFETHHSKTSPSLEVLNRERD